MRFIIIIMSLFVISGCTTTVGPYITHAVNTPDGLKVRKCERSVSVLLGIVGGQEKNCKYELIPDEEEEDD